MAVCCLIMAAAEVGALFVINSLRANDAQVERRFLERSRLLEQIRSSIYLSGTVARDLLLAPAGSASSQMAEVTSLQRHRNGRGDRNLSEIARTGRSCGVRKPPVRDRSLLAGIRPNFRLERRRTQGIPVSVFFIAS